MSQTFIKTVLQSAITGGGEEYDLRVVNGDINIEFKNTPNPLMYINGVEYPVMGKVYVMGEKGNTISTFTPVKKDVIGLDPDNPIAAWIGEKFLQQKAEKEERGLSIRPLAVFRYDETHFILVTKDKLYLTPTFVLGHHFDSAAETDIFVDGRDIGSFVEPHHIDRLKATLTADYAELAYTNLKFHEPTERIVTKPFGNIDKTFCGLDLSCTKKSYSYFCVETQTFVIAVKDSLNNLAFYTTKISASSNAKIPLTSFEILQEHEVGLEYIGRGSAIQYQGRNYKETDELMSAHMGVSCPVIPDDIYGVLCTCGHTGKRVLSVMDRNRRNNERIFAVMD